ncbi:AbrB/MazE/SpoVT family DNA-binding domain-containing protein [Jeotgalibaca arthritidis]|uniref:AbrB/MazE/SpoVT family DNA-binding domain-containing protein n=1 Tax=Jeotgalibaca arthritidis TaxID=1868794 RepID=UPI00359F9CC5
MSMKIIQSSTQKSGHSVMTTLPPDVLEKLDMSAGDHIEYVIKENGVEVRKASDREKDFLATVNAVMDDYNAALEELINR